MASEVQIRRPAPPPSSTLIDGSTTPSRGALVVQVLLRLLVAAVFIYAAQGKIRNPANFAKEIQKYGLAPDEATHLMAVVLPWMEVIAPVLLLVGFLRAESRFWLLLMLVVFTGVKVYALARGLNIHCGCVDADSPIAFLFKDWNGVWTNLVLIAALVIDGLLDRTSFRARWRSSEPLSPATA